ncbi:hypothetical protein ABK040_001175 [Willaertia magna]
MTEYKIVVIGSGGVGKSALTIQYIQQTFVERYDPTIEDSYRKQVEIDDIAVMLDILDTAGQEEYHTLAGEYMGKGHGFVIVYSITDVQTFEDTPKYYEEILKAKVLEEGEKVPIILVGNKSDLEDERAVSKEEGEEQAKKFGECCQFFETSAKTRENVDEVFQALVKLINVVEGVEETEAQNNETVPTETTPQTATPTNNTDQQTTTTKKKKKKKCLIL